MNEALPAVLKSSRALGNEFFGTVALSRLSRLSELLNHGEAGAARLRVRFDVFKDDWQRLCLQGQVSGELPTRCQNCLKTTRLSVEREFFWRPIEDEADWEEDDRRYEPVLYGQGRVLEIYKYVEDEVLLAMPNILRCPDTENCRRPDYDTGGDTGGEKLN